MTKKNAASPVIAHEHHEIAKAVEQYVAQGGVINVVREGESREANVEAEKKAQALDADAQLSARIEQLKGLVAKGAGVSALQYSLRMNRKELKRLASENGVKIRYCRPVRGSRASRGRDAATVDDIVAGHAMHYSRLGYTVPEIAQLLDLSVRDVWNIGKAYRFEFKSASQVGSPAQHVCDVPESSE